MPAFLYQEFRRGPKAYERVGSPVWKVRFAPVETGRYSYQVVARNRGTQAASPAASFLCTPRRARGTIRISKANPLACEFENGEPYFPSGINLFTFTRLGQPIPNDRLDLCERWMSRLAEHEGNFVRLRMDSWWLAIEMTPDPAAGYLGLGLYHQRTCWDVYRIYDLAARLGIYVMHAPLLNIVRRLTHTRTTTSLAWALVVAIVAIAVSLAASWAMARVRVLRPLVR